MNSNPNPCLVLLTLAVATIGCGGAGLGEVDVPDGFQFDTTGPIRIAIEHGGTLAAADRRSFSGIEVARENGHVLYRGTARSDRPLVVNLGLPLVDRSVRLTVTRAGERFEQAVPVIDGVVRAEVSSVVPESVDSQTNLQLPIDTDDDTIPDVFDVYPHDAQLASVGHSPAEDQFGMVMFEDMWPHRYDYDLNDAVVAYNYKYRYDSQNRLVSLRASFDVLALGGEVDLGLGLSIDGLDRAQVDQVEVTVGRDGVASDATVLSDRNLTFVITDDMRRRLFGGTARAINSSPWRSRQQGLPVVVEIRLRSPQWIEPLVAPHDLFIFRTDEPGYEVHRAYASGTSRIDESLFGTADDGSDASRSFVDGRGLPFAVVLAEVSPYPAEAVDLAVLYPDVLDFAASAGTRHPNFYKGNRNLSAAFVDSNGQGMFEPRLLTCVHDPDCRPPTP